MQFQKLFLVFFLIYSSFSFAQIKKQLARPSDSLNKIGFVNTVEQGLKFYLADMAKKYNSSELMAELNYQGNEIPTVGDETYCERLERLNDMSPFHLDCNSITLSVLKNWGDKKRSFIKIVLGRAGLYFPMYEAKLAEYGLPLELKYLSVIESGLRPQVKSKAGALGLWQFMYGTGQYYGLKENSYIDERMDPEKETDAACRFLKQLYDIYGDWNLALAAYNAGPGTVNKAIKRSGNKTTYWEVRPYLPTETQGYVPAFIAAAYYMNYYNEHNIKPAEVKINFYTLDTICLPKAVHMATISKLMDWNLEEIKELNPIYKTAYVPKASPASCIYGPSDIISKLVGLEDSLYTLEESIYFPKKPEPAPVLDTTKTKDSTLAELKEILHVVKMGETVKSIAQKYNVNTEDIMTWNQLSTAILSVGQEIKVKQKAEIKTPPVNQKESMINQTAPKTQNTTQTNIQNQKPQTNTNNVTQKPTNQNTTVIKNIKPENKKPVETKKYHTVKKGDTFTRIAVNNGLTVQQLKTLNPGINAGKIRAGQKIRIK
ncbi:MAG: LysM peptidoglycan-binding domain-containing protein [Bacteroidetes bacterium]|nr:LysM peptidoglycan-binding domain-containing protein [Bacteroidota bacterium]